MILRYVIDFLVAKFLSNWHRVYLRFLFFELLSLAGIF